MGGCTVCNHLTGLNYPSLHHTVLRTASIHCHPHQIIHSNLSRPCSSEGLPQSAYMPLTNNQLTPFLGASHWTAHATALRILLWLLLLSPDLSLLSGMLPRCSVIKLCQVSPAGKTWLKIALPLQSASCLRKATSWNH